MPKSIVADDPGRGPARGSPDGSWDPPARAPETIETAGVEFIDENGGGPGVRLRNQQRDKA